VTLGSEVALRNLLGRSNWFAIKGMETDPNHAYYDRADLRFHEVQRAKGLDRIPQRSLETDEEDRCFAPTHEAAEQLVGPEEPGTEYIVNLLRVEAESHQSLADVYISRGEVGDLMGTTHGPELTNLGLERMRVESCENLASAAESAADLRELEPWMRVDIARHLFDEAWIYLRDRENPSDVTGLELSMARLIGQDNWDRIKEQAESYWNQGLPHFGYVDTKKPLI